METSYFIKLKKELKVYDYDNDVIIIIIIITFLHRAKYLKYYLSLLSLFSKYL